MRNNMPSYMHSSNAMLPIFLACILLRRHQGEEAVKDCRCNLLHQAHSREGQRMDVGMLYSRVRVEEKLLFEEFERRGVNVLRIDDRETVLEMGECTLPCRVVLERCINQSRALY